MASDTPNYPWLKNYPPGIDWFATLPQYPLWDILDRAAARYPRRVCMDFFDKHTSYEETARLVDSAAAGLQALGVNKGDRVGLLLPNTPYFIIFYFAILKAGGVVVNLNPLYAERELERLIHDSGLKLAVTIDLKVIYEKVARMLDKTPLERLVVCSLCEALPLHKGLLFKMFKRADLAFIPRDERHVPYDRLLHNHGEAKHVEIHPEDDIAVLQYTGGTTGIPKAAMLTHANLVANVLQSRLWFSHAREGEEVVLSVLPFFHVFAMTVAMNLGVLIGATIVMVPKFELKQLVALIHRKRPTLFPAVPTLYAAIANYRGLSDYDISSVRYCISGGAGLPVEVKKAFEAVTGCVVAEGYGLTESSPVATCNPLDGVNKAGSIGLPLPRTIIEIVSMEDHQTVLPVGQRGEICIRGPQVMKAYWKNKEETDGVLRPLPEGGFRLHTGDAGTMDDEGYIYVVDRIKDMFLCGGYNVYPRVVEEAIMQHPDVMECIVAGLPDPYRGQTVKAYLVMKAGKSLTRDQLVEFLHDKLSPIEIPKQVEFRQSLPKTMIGKPSRKALLDEEMEKRAKTQSDGPSNSTT
ncbi:MAG TPA: long-chain fatty acid--CoA ligase [Alphaproteobacteria bacterium]|nr:long-chain fatty acid--CoA ligase [Alphaproteobacteria bacterium]